MSAVKAPPTPPSAACPLWFCSGACAPANGGAPARSGATSVQTRGPGRDLSTARRPRGRSRVTRLPPPGPAPHVDLPSPCAVEPAGHRAQPTDHGLAHGAAGCKQIAPRDYVPFSRCTCERAAAARVRAAQARNSTTGCDCQTFRLLLEINSSQWDMTRKMQHLP